MSASIQEFFKDFYATSDDGTAHEKYTTFFTPDAKLIIGDNSASGRSEILKLRQSMWEAVASRKHTFSVYSSQDHPNSYLLQGLVTYGFKAGGEKAINWVAKADFEGEGSEKRMGFYQVFVNVGSK